MLIGAFFDAIIKEWREVLHFLFVVGLPVTTPQLRGRNGDKDEKKM